MLPRSDQQHCINMMNNMSRSDAQLISKHADLVMRELEKSRIPKTLIDNPHSPVHVVGRAIAWHTYLRVFFSRGRSDYERHRESKTAWHRFREAGLTLSDELLTSLRRPGATCTQWEVDSSELIKKDPARIYCTIEFLSVNRPFSWLDWDVSGEDGVFELYVPFGEEGEIKRVPPQACFLRGKGNDAEVFAFDNSIASVLSFASDSRYSTSINAPLHVGWAERCYGDRDPWEYWVERESSGASPAAGSSQG